MAQEPPFKNVYHKRLVADSASRACYICCKPTPVVLVSSDSKGDFFYVCEIHLKDPAFATPVISSEVTQAKERVAKLQPEIDLLESQIEAKKKAENPGYIASFFKGSKKTDSSKDKKDEKSKDKKEESPAAPTSWDKEQSLLDKLKQSKEEALKVANTPPRVYNLSKSFYVMRINKHKASIISKNFDKVLKSPTAFPKIPTHTPGAIVKPPSTEEKPVDGSNQDTKPDE